MEAHAAQLALLLALASFLGVEEAGPSLPTNGTSHRLEELHRHLLEATPETRRRLRALASRLKSSRKAAGAKYHPPPHSNETDAPGESTSDREKRLLSLFTLVGFQKSPCNSSHGDNGTCFSKAECLAQGGVPSGSCSLGFISCCVFARSCGAVVAQNDTYFVNPNSPSNFDGTGSCQFTILRCAKNVCFIRLLFNVLALAPPVLPDHVCLNDQFIVAGGSPVPIICGQNTGNHMIIDAAGSNNAFTVTIVTSGTTFERSWKIKVTQLECESAYGNPGCLQYFTGASGKIMTYNYDHSTGLQLSNQDYSVCIRREAGFCGIQYTVCRTPPEAAQSPSSQRKTAFSISTPQGGGFSSQVGDQNCMQDWIIIPCATNVANSLIQDDQQACKDRLCGNRFNSVNGRGDDVPVYSYSNPFVIYVHFNGNEQPDANNNNRGFCFTYIQQPCTANISG